MRLSSCKNKRRYDICISRGQTDLAQIEPDGDVEGFLLINSQKKEQHQFSAWLYTVTVGPICL